MATTTLSLNPTLITVPANTDEHDIDFSAVLPVKRPGFTGYAEIVRVSGASIQFNCNDKTITAASAAVNATQTTLRLPLLNGVKLRYKGGAGSESFYITITAPSLT